LAKIVAIWTSSWFYQRQMNLTLSTSWKTSCKIVSTHTWTHALGFLINIFLLCKVFLMIKPLPSGMEKFIIMQMCNKNKFFKKKKVFLKYYGLQAQNQIRLCKIF
jgi:hypothetical protein